MKLMFFKQTLFFFVKPIPALRSGLWGDDQIRWRGSVGSTFEITPYLDTANVDPETKRVLDVALEMTRKCLGLEDDFANGMIANQIIEIAKTGERDPDLLCEAALKKLRQGLFGD